MERLRGKMTNRGARVNVLPRCHELEASVLPITPRLPLSPGHPGGRAGKQREGQGCRRLAARGAIVGTVSPSCLPLFIQIEFIPISDFLFQHKPKYLGAVSATESALRKSTPICCILGGG